MSVNTNILLTRIEAALKKREFAYRLIEEADEELAKCTRELKQEEKDARSRT